MIIPESKINISLIGEDGAVLTDDAYASKKNCFGEEMSTSGSSTVYIYAPDFYAENITFANTAGRVGQAVACFVDGDRAYFKNCRFLGIRIHFIRMEKTVVSIMKDAISKEQSTLSLDGLLPCLKTVLFTV